MIDLISPFKAVRNKAPLVQCITNFVTVNDCANIILAAGGSPSMSQDIREVEESVCRANALVCNMGAIDFVDSMILAGRKANQVDIPVVLDPVAAGGTTLRRTISAALLEQVHFTAIRGNASEIRALAGQSAVGHGVDVRAEDAVTDRNLSDVIEMAKELARKTGSVIAISGSVDIVTDGEQTALIRNGCATMARITGSGCMLTSLIGTFCGACGDAFHAACAVMAVMGVSGEIADEKRLCNGTGNAAFRNDLIDAVWNLTEEQLKRRVRYEIHK